MSRKRFNYVFVLDIEPATDDDGERRSSKRETKRRSTDRTSDNRASNSVRRVDSDCDAILARFKSPVCVCSVSREKTICESFKRIFHSKMRFYVSANISQISLCLSPQKLQLKRGSNESESVERKLSPTK